MSARDHYPNQSPNPDASDPYVGLARMDYDMAMLELDGLRAEVAELKAEREELLRVMKLETLADVQLDLLRTALVKWARRVGDLVGFQNDEAEVASEELFALVPGDGWGMP